MRQDIFCCYFYWIVYKFDIDLKEYRKKEVIQKAHK